MGGEIEKVSGLGATHQQPGTVVGGAYRIVELLSEGGMGAVYVAEQISIQRMRALKLMLPHLVASDRLRARFLQEARIGSRIASEHVVEVIDSGVDAELGVPWIAMELLDGETLGERCERGPLSIGEWTSVLTEACHAIAAAHRAGIVHRDLKPENVFLAKARSVGVAHTVKVLDFGIAKLVSESAIAATQAIGTPLYMPPEQMENGGRIMPAADVWSLALVAFHALTGKSYWRCGNVDDATPIMVLKEIGSDPIVPPSERARELGVPSLWPARFDEWFLGAVNRRLEARYPDASALAGAWHAILAASPAPQASGLAALNRTVAASPMDLEALADRAREHTETPPTNGRDEHDEDDAAMTDASPPPKKRKKRRRATPSPMEREETRIPVYAPPTKTEKSSFNTLLLIPIGLVVISLIVAATRC